MGAALLGAAAGGACRGGGGRHAQDRGGSGPGADLVLLNGRVKLGVGESEEMVYDVRQNGEAFGWSSLIGRSDYSASAECIEPSKLLKTDRKKLQEILEADPANGIIFFKQLAATLGNRLIESYKKI